VGGESGWAGRWAGLGWRHFVGDRGGPWHGRRVHRYLPAPPVVL